MTKFSQFPFFLFLLASFACTKGKEIKTELVFTLSSLTAGNSYPGGGILRIENPSTGVSFNFDLTTSNKISLPEGIWNFYFVGFSGTSLWQGTNECGTTASVNLLPPAQTVEIAVDNSNCSAATYVAMIATKNASALIGEWDESKWNEAVWGP